jgi:hypothetical protein
VSAAHVALLRRLDGLYRSVVSSPESWSEDEFAGYATDMFGEGWRPSRSTAKHARAALRMAVKLRDFWAEPPPGVPSDAGDWRTRVDLAFGIRAWRPLLAIAQAGLDESPSADLYEETKRRFREVNGVSWMEGVSYEEWRQQARG